MNSEILIYQTPDGNTKIDVRLEEETVWLSQQQMADMFQTSKQNISLHIKNIFTEGELHDDSVVKEYLTTAPDGKRYKTLHYNIDVVISVGYRVKSHVGTHFRIWAKPIPGVCRTPGHESEAHAHGRLAGKAQRFFNAERPGDTPA